MCICPQLLVEIEEKLNEEVNAIEDEESGVMTIKIKNTTNMKAIKVWRSL